MMRMKNKPTEPLIIDPIKLCEESHFLRHFSTGNLYQLNETQY